MSPDFRRLAIFPLALALALPSGQSQLKSRSDAHQMPLLRDALGKHPRASDFYVGEVACAFNQTASCEEGFGKVLATEPESATAKQIHHILTAVETREGRYERALLEIDAWLAIDPNDDDAKSSRPFMEALSHFSDQAAQGATKAAVQMDNGRLPILINGKRASYFFDTEANLSILSQSDAMQFGMRIQGIKGTAVSTDINGNKVSLRIAVAESITLGSITLSNVAFLIGSDEQQPFVDMRPGERGLIGLPVLLTLRSVTWTRTGVFEADRTPAPANLAAANLCFDDLDLVTQASFERHVLPFVLDAGAAKSALWPKSADVAKSLIHKSGTRESQIMTGMGGEQKYQVTSIPKVLLNLSGTSVSLELAHILDKQQKDAAKWFYGNLGIDSLHQVQRVSINLKTMTLRLEGDRQSYSNARARYSPWVTKS